VGATGGGIAAGNESVGAAEGSDGDGTQSLSDIAERPAGAGADGQGVAGATEDTFEGTGQENPGGGMSAGAEAPQPGGSEVQAGNSGVSGASPESATPVRSVAEEVAAKWAGRTHDIPLLRKALPKAVHAPRAEKVINGSPAGLQAKPRRSKGESPKKYLTSVGVAGNLLQEATNGILRTLSLTAGGRVGESGSYAQNELFGSQGTEGTGRTTHGAGQKAAAVLRDDKANPSASADLVAGLQGDWGALAR